MYQLIWMLSNVDIQIVNHPHNQVSNYQQQLDQPLLYFGQMIQIGLLQQTAMVDLVSWNDWMNKILFSFEFNF